MSKQTNKKAPKKKAANGYQLAKPVPLGEILIDNAKKQWKIGPSIGSGGFGEIYSAILYKGTEEKKKSYNYVVKIEPHGNGPLFVEMHFYLRNAKKEDIDAWMKQHKIVHLGMPQYIASGSHEVGGEKCRFLVMERFGKDLWSVFLESGRIFPISTVFRIGYQVLNVLEYIHSRGYVHADIKGANILLAVDAKLKYQTYLVDFGLASHYTIKEFKPDPKKAHNGTIEYTSRDAHNGVPTRRGDIEILLYNLLQWLGHSLPWEKNLTDPVVVQKEKEKFFSSTTALKSFLNLPDEFNQLYKYVMSMKYDTEPDYNKLRSILLAGITNYHGNNDDSALIFKTPPIPKQGKKVAQSKVSLSPNENIPLKKTSEKSKKPSNSTRKPLIEDASNKKTQPLKRKSPMKPDNKLPNAGMFNLEDLSGSDDDYEPSTPVKKKASTNTEQKETRSMKKSTPVTRKPRISKLTEKSIDDLSINSFDKSESDIFASFEEDLKDATLESEVVPKKVTPGSKYHPKNIPPSECSSHSDEEKETNSRGRNKRKILVDSVDKNKTPKKTRARVTLKKTTPTNSWRNFPTIKNGRGVGDK